MSDSRERDDVWPGADTGAPEQVRAGGGAGMCATSLTTPPHATQHMKQRAERLESHTATQLGGEGLTQPGSRGCCEGWPRPTTSASERASQPQARVHTRQPSSLRQEFTPESPAASGKSPHQTAPQPQTAESGPDPGIEHAGKRLSMQMLINAIWTRMDMHGGYENDVGRERGVTRSRGIRLQVARSAGRHGRRLSTCGVVVAAVAAVVLQRSGRLRPGTWGSCSEAFVAAQWACGHNFLLEAPPARGRVGGHSPWRGQPLEMWQSGATRGADRGHQKRLRWACERTCHHPCLRHRLFAFPPTLLRPPHSAGVCVGRPATRCWFEKVGWPATRTHHSPAVTRGSAI
eukprot:356435-Chlamydomonas_euryale.AAC.4